MINSYIYKDECGYINMHSEQSYKGYQNKEFLDENYLANISYGIYSNELTESTVKELEEFIITLKEKGNIKKLILDFQKLEKVQKNLEKQLNNCKDQIIALGINLIVMNVSMEIARVFNDENGHFEYIEDKKFILAYSISELEEIKGELENDKTIIYSLVKEIENYGLISMIEKCSVDGEFTLESSPVVTTKYINIKKCIETINYFPYYIYKLALDMITKKLVSNNPKENRDIRLLCHTLNGSYISGLLAKLLCIDLSFLDHLGPKNKIYNTFLENKFDKRKRYVIVTDVICLKSELRAVRALLDYERACYSGAVTIVYCNTVGNREDDYNILSLLEINKQNNNKFNYFIKTDLMEEGK